MRQSCGPRPRRSTSLLVRFAISIKGTSLPSSEACLKIMMNQEIKTVFFGTPEFGAIVLRQLIEADLKPVLVVTNPDEPAGRKQVLTSPPVKVLAEQHNIPVLQPENVSDIKDKLTNLNPDLIALASYGKILPKEILEIPAHGALNVHPSLLPKYRGASPVQSAILEGENKTGVSIMLMDEKMDHGPIVAQEEFPEEIGERTSEELRPQLAKFGGNLLSNVIPDWVQGNIEAKEQDHSLATYTKQFQKEDGHIDWNCDAEYIESQIRAFMPWPGTFTYYAAQNMKQRIKILRARAMKGMNGKEGAVFETPDKKLGVYCGKDALEIEELQLEGKKPTSSRDFLLGRRDIIGIQFQ